MSIAVGPNVPIMANGAQGDAHYAEFMQFLRWANFFLEPVVKQIGLNVAPASPADGDAYVIGSAPTGTWAGLGNRIARWSTVTGAWETLAPKQGWTVEDYATQASFSFNGTAWASTTYVDAAVVHKAGTETMTGLKKISFNSADLVPAIAGAGLQLIGADGAATGVEVVCAGASASPSLLFRHRGGTIAAPTPTAVGTAIGVVSFRGFGTTTEVQASAWMRGYAAETFTDAAQGTGIEFYTTPVGTLGRRQAGYWGPDGVLSAGYGVLSSSVIEIDRPVNNDLIHIKESGVTKWIVYAPTTGTLGFWNSTSGLALSIKSTGVMAVPAGINIGNGSVALNAYDEGTWTPTPTNLGGTGITYSTKWTKVGNRIDFAVTISGTGLAATVNSTRLSLPFANARVSVACADNGSNVGAVCEVSGSTVYLPTITSTTQINVSGTFFLN